SRPPPAVTSTNVPLAVGAGVVPSNAPMSGARPTTRGNPGPRWSNGRFHGLAPRFRAALPGRSAWVLVRPPLSASGPRRRSVPNGRLLALAAPGMNPLGLPTALWSRTGFPENLMSGPSGPEFPDTMLLMMLAVDG